MSCSDKISLWVACGVQGALLSRVLDGPIHLSSITVGCKALWEEITHERKTVEDHIKFALVDRLIRSISASKSITSVPLVPHIATSSAQFVEGKGLSIMSTMKSSQICDAKQYTPCPDSLIWRGGVSGVNDRCEVLVSHLGRRQGVGKTSLTIQNMSNFCKRALLASFVELIPLSQRESDSTYASMKVCAENEWYYILRSQAKAALSAIFGTWTAKEGEWAREESFRERG